MITGFKQLILVRDKDSCSNRFQRFSWISDFDFIWKELTCYFAFLLNLVADKGSDKVKSPVGNKTPSEDLVWLKVRQRKLLGFLGQRSCGGQSLKIHFLPHKSVVNLGRLEQHYSVKEIFWYWFSFAFKIKRLKVKLKKIFNICNSVFWN